MSAQRSGAGRWRVLVAAGWLFGAACGEPAPPALPDGAHLRADGAALRDTLARLNGLEGTPLGRVAEDLSLRLADCAEVAANAPGGGLVALLDSLECADPTPNSEALARLRGDAAFTLLMPIGRAHRVIAHGWPGPDGDLAVDVRLDPPEAASAAALFLPAAGSAGAPVLGDSGAYGERLIHARVRPRDGVDLTALVPEGSQGDRLFRLKSALFGRAVLGDVWEVAVYMPRAGGALPPMALAIDIRRRALAEEAVETFLAELGAIWPIHPTPATFAGHAGACLFDLRILPDFAPCYAATERALVVGWNRDSMDAAFSAPARSAGAAGPSRLAVHLARFEEADRRLQAARSPDTAERQRSWGWRRLDVVPGAEVGALRVELSSAEPAG